MILMTRVRGASPNLSDSTRLFLYTISWVAEKKKNIYKKNDATILTLWTHVADNVGDRRAKYFVDPIRFNTSISKLYLEGNRKNRRKII
jgi:hypothetical protein